jgi:hypothetical protein
MAIDTLGSMALDAKNLQIALLILPPILQLLDVIGFERKPRPHPLTTMLATAPASVEQALDA